MTTDHRARPNEAILPGAPNSSPLQAKPGAAALPLRSSTSYPGASHTSHTCACLARSCAERGNTGQEGALSIYCRACDLPAQHLGLVDPLVVLLLMPQRPAAHSVNKTRFSTPAKPVPYSPFPQDSSPRFDRPGPRNITWACLASPRRATPTAFPQLLSAPFLAWALPAPFASTPASLQARKPASLHCHKLPPTVSYYLPAARAPRTTHNHNFAPRPPASRILGTPLQGCLSGLHWRHPPGFSLLLRRWTPRSLPGSSRQLPTGPWTSVYDHHFSFGAPSLLPPLSPSRFFLDHPAAPSPQNPRGRKEGRNPGRKEGITRTRPCPLAQGKSGPSSASIDLDRVDPKIQTRPLILNRVQQTPAACRTQSPRDLHIVLPATL